MEALSRTAKICLPHAHHLFLRRTAQLHSSALLRMFIQTESTPNPESIKFIPGRGILADLSKAKERSVSDEDSYDNFSDNSDKDITQGVYITKSEDDKELLRRSPLSKTLLTKIPGVKSLYLGGDFISVTKTPAVQWDIIKPLIFESIMDYYADTSPGEFKQILKDSDSTVISDTTILDTDSEVVAMIKELLETRIRPAVMEDGGDIMFVGFEEDTGIVTVKLAGSCVGCPSSTITLKNGVENMLQHYIPEVESVIALEEEGEETADFVEDPAVVKQKSYEDKLRDAGIPFSD